MTPNTPTNRGIGGRGDGGSGVSSGGIIMANNSSTSNYNYFQQQTQPNVRNRSFSSSSFKRTEELRTKKSSFRSVVFATNDLIQQFNTSDPASSIQKKKQRRKRISISSSTSATTSPIKRQRLDNSSSSKDDDYYLKTEEKSQKQVSNNLEQKTMGLASDRSEVRYWYESFGLLGGSISQGTKPIGKVNDKVYAHSRALSIDASSSSIINQIYFNPNIAVNDERNKNKSIVTSNHCTMAVAAGPRVQLYGTTYESTFHQLLSQHSLENTGNKSKNNIITTADKQVPTSGQLAISISFRNDGRLVAIGTDRGIIRVTDSTTRTTILQFGIGQNSTTSTSVNTAADTTALPTTIQSVFVAPVPVRSVIWFNDGQHILSAGDDAVVRVWQLPHSKSITDVNDNSNSPVLNCIGHGDSIRCAILWQQTPIKIDTTTKKNVYNESYPYKTLAATGSYDHTIRLWNLEMDDDVTTGRFNQNLQSKRPTDRCVAVLEHGSPVEALVWVSSGSEVNQSSSSSSTSTPSLTSQLTPVWLVSAGGTTIKVWNPMNGTCVSTIVTQHRKSITSLLAVPRIYRHPSISPIHENSIEYRLRIVSGGLDGFLRIYSFNRTNGRLEHLHGMKISNPINEKKSKQTNNNNAVITEGGITALAATPSADRIAIGLSSGVVLVRQKGPSIISTKKTKEPRPGTFSFFTRGMNSLPSIDDTIVTGAGITGTDISIKRRKLTKYDIAFKQFRYGDALDVAFDMRNPQIIINVIEELGKRHALRISLSNRDEITLEPILSFIVRYISIPKYSELLIGVTNTLLRIYGNNINKTIGSGSANSSSSSSNSTGNSNHNNTTTILGHSDIIDELFEKLRIVVKNECRLQKSIFQILGKIDSIMTAAEMDN